MPERSGDDNFDRPRHRPRPPGAVPRRRPLSAAVIRRRQRVVGGCAALLLLLILLAVFGRVGLSSGTSVAAGVTGKVEQGATATRGSVQSAASGAKPSRAATSTATSATKSNTQPVSVPSKGTGVLVTVPGAPVALTAGSGKVIRVRVQVEQGLGPAIKVVPEDFADEVLRTLNDSRSWGRGGTSRYVRTTGAAEITVILATPGTSAALCRPLQTAGRLSCRRGSRAILTAYRWINGTPEFSDLTVYRQYVVNHEVGHVLGKSHRPCVGAGQLAPVMQQQTIRVAPCRPNPWPYP